ncbi:MAG: S41 family peptidase [Bacteroidota bacterium]|nr:S41 family peptidase [Bacteroidota bacterium]
MNKKYNYLLPLLLSIMFALGMLVGTKFSPDSFRAKNNDTHKFKEVISHINTSYIDTVNNNKLVELAVKKVINNLDPHSAYISKSELTAVTQDLQGDFEGIGIEFNILNDTLIVVSPISGGPSEKLGIKAGDKIITVDEENIAGVGLTNADVRNKLLGKKGTIVKVEILRNGNKEVLAFDIVRDKIPIYSIDAAYMADDKTAYIKINRFSAKTASEFVKALNKLENEGMQNLILDLGENPGGYLQVAFQVTDQFFNSKKIIVYTKGRARKREEYYSSKRGGFKTGKLVVLIDEGSASASEIVAGAVQDWDRGFIIGRRSFGKGLVQEQMELTDKSALRLTVAKYFTPSGRFIQKPYKNESKADYYLDIYNRYLNGELTNKDSIDIPDSLKYQTDGGRIVYGGGGIIPDFFVAIDTSMNSNYLSQLIHKGLIYKYTLEYLDKNRLVLKKRYPDFKQFDAKFNTNSIWNDFLTFATKEGVTKNEKDLKSSGELIKLQLKALIARQLFDHGSYFRIINQSNNEFQKAIEVINSDMFDKMGIHY